LLKRSKTIYDYIQDLKREEEEKIKQLAALGKVEPTYPRISYKDLHPDDKEAIDELYEYLRRVHAKFGFSNNEIETLEDLTIWKDARELIDGEPGDYKNNMHPALLFDGSIEDKERCARKFTSYISFSINGIEAPDTRIRKVTLEHMFNYKLKRIEFLYDESFTKVLRKFDHLEDLILFNPNFSTLDISDLPHLKRLMVWDGMMDSEKINKLFSNRDQVNLISYLHPSVFLSNIRNLDINNQQIAGFPELQGETLSRLVYLRIMNNQADTLDLINAGKFAYKFPYLSFIYFQNNKIRQIPEGFGKLKNLLEISLSKNPLDFIAEDLGDAPKLLNFYNDQFDKLNAADPFFFKIINNIYNSKRIIHTMSFNAGELILPNDPDEKVRIIEQLRQTTDLAYEIVLYELSLPEEELLQRLKFYHKEYEKRTEWLGYEQLFDWKDELRRSPPESYVNRLINRLQNESSNKATYEELKYKLARDPHYIYGILDYGSNKLQDIDPRYHLFQGKCRCPTIYDERLDEWLFSRLYQPQEL
jgi:Leucine-rich repeat (LRR) protein